ncbi:MAG TPA: DUF885 family protein [Xanthomonadales bacterium]|nr:DUF885 family protein [Xanthomonadales bacterium]
MSNFFSDRKSPPRFLLLALAMCSISFCLHASEASDNDGYSRLIELFEDWRDFENPPRLEGAPDYTEATNQRRHQELEAYKERLKAIDHGSWPIPQQVDWHLVRAEMNGMDFNIRVLKPWARDPAFYVSVWTYQSDTPAHEGPTPHALVELWQFTPPLDAGRQQQLARDLATVPPLLRQARVNLTGNARDLWMSGIGSVEDQSAALEEYRASLVNPGDDLISALENAMVATREFKSWLEQQAPDKTGPSGIGIEDYSWYLQQVHYVPLDWEEEVTLLRRELDRAHSYLRLEEHRNRDVPPLVAISSPAEYEDRADASVTRYMDFLENEKILQVRDYMDPALRVRTGSFVPEETRNFFWTAVHYEPMTLWTHFYHWFDLAQMEHEPHQSPIRRDPLLYNIFDSRAEGLATGMEEMMMHAGLYDDNPHAREIVYIMLAQRAARGLASLYAQANEFTMKDARDFHVKWTPRGWMREDLDLLGFEQQLYLRQPGYGTSYITGKYLIERLLAERSRQVEQQGGEYTLYDFFGELDSVGVIPVSLIRWQLTGYDDEIRALMSDQ